MGQLWGIFNTSKYGWTLTRFVDRKISHGAPMPLPTVEVDETGLSHLLVAHEPNMDLSSIAVPKLIKSFEVE